MQRSLLAMFALCCTGTLWAQSDITFREQTGESLDVLRNGRLVARYVTAHDATTNERRLETYKPFLHVFDATGESPITKGPGGEFSHHRGIFLGWNKITANGRTFDRWHMPDGEQVHQQFSAIATGSDPSFTSQVAWMGAGGEPPILEEQRTFTFLPPPAGAYALIDVQAQLRAPAGPVHLDGDPEHAGLQFRPAGEIDRKETVYLYPVANADPHRDRDYPWVGESFTLRGRQYSVVYLNHPGNPRDACASAYRDYGRFGMFFRTTIRAGETAVFRVRFLVAEGPMPAAAAIQQAWNDFAGLQHPVPETTSRPAEASAPPVQKPKDRTADRGPEQPEIRFRVPPPEPLSPAEAQQALRLPPGFEAQLVASEPMLEAPVAVSFDAQARLYVCEMRGYMNDVEGRGEDQPTGRISRLEDTDGDGVFERASVFVDGLLMPRAVMALGDGALVAEPPHLVWHRDTDGDGVADQRQLVSDTFGENGGQPEHMANSPLWALDNWIECANHDTRYRFRGGAFLAEPAPRCGQWGLAQDDQGRLFFNYNSDLLRAHLLPARASTRNPSLAVRTARNFQTIRDQTCWPAHPTPGVNRGYAAGQLRDDGTLRTVTAVGGATIYRGDLFPAEFRGNAFVPEPAGNLVKRLVLHDEGGVVTATNAYEGREFLTSTDERFRPVNACTGPDGALYVVDMGRGVIQHRFFLTHYLLANIAERRLEGPLRCGRIWRIVPTGVRPPAVKLPHETAAIVPLLAHGNGQVRDQAQRVLCERGDASVVEAVQRLAADAPSPLGRVHALWTLDGLGGLTTEVVAARFLDSDARVRAAAVRLADRSLVPKLLALVDDPSAQVRLQLALQLGSHPGTEAALSTLLAADPTPLCAEAIVSGLRGRELEFVQHLLRQPASRDGAMAASGIVSMLAACVMAERRSARVTGLLELAAEQIVGSTRQLALLEGMAGKAQGRVDAGKQVLLDAAPAALAKLAASTTGPLRDLVLRLDAQLSWPGKTGATPPPAIVPLTVPEQARFERGRVLYGALCAACHQPTGTGLAGLAPPLVDSEWVLGPVDRLTRIVLHGLTGPVPVGGTVWQLEMPPLGSLGDEDLAATLTYVRRAWQHGSSPVAPADVAKIRAAFAGRTQAWTADELLQTGMSGQQK